MSHRGDYVSISETSVVIVAIRIPQGISRFRSTGANLVSCRYLEVGNLFHTTAGMNAEPICRRQAMTGT
jgi:hypothetical protein